MKIGFIGAGQMAQALAAGIHAANGNVEFFISDPSPKAVADFRQRASGGKAETGKVTVCETNDEVGGQVDVLFLAIKPQFLEEACQALSTTREARPLVISIVAGAKLDYLKSLTGIDRVVRVMPNTPCLVNCGASAIAATEELPEVDFQLAMGLMEPIGIIERVTEPQLDAITGMSGSGPAYVFTFIEALSDGGVLMGLPRGMATRFAIQTVLGSAELARQSDDHPAVLRDRVASPGGTTIAGIEVLESLGVRAAVMGAVRAAAERSAELGG